MVISWYCHGTFVVLLWYFHGTLSMYDEYHGTHGTSWYFYGTVWYIHGTLSSTMVLCVANLKYAHVDAKCGLILIYENIKLTFIYFSKNMQYFYNSNFHLINQNAHFMNFVFGENIVCSCEPKSSMIKYFSNCHFMCEDWCTNNYLEITQNYMRYKDNFGIQTENIFRIKLRRHSSESVSITQSDWEFTKRFPLALFWSACVCLHLCMHWSLRQIHYDIANVHHACVLPRSAIITRSWLSDVLNFSWCKGLMGTVRFNSW